MKKMNPKLVATVRKALKGSKLAKFNASIKVLNDSLAQGQWIQRGSVKAETGFYQGIARVDEDPTWNKLNVCTPEWYASTGVSYVFNYGMPPRFMQPGKLSIDKANKFFKMKHAAKVELGIKTLREHGNLKLPDTVVRAWIDLVMEKEAAKAFLNEARPKPVITKIGLSPKVTKTLTEMNLDLHLPSIRMADIVAKKVQDIDSETLKPLFDEDGKPVMITMWVVKWTKGIKLNMTRFSLGSGCEACGRPIPSGSFVPVEAKDKKSGKLIGMWIGCDCAKNIFGIKDVGIKREGK